MGLADQLRQKIRESGKSANQLAEESGVPQPMLTRFLNGKDLRLATVDKLADFFGLKLCDKDEAKPAKPKAKRRK